MTTLAGWEVQSPTHTLSLHVGLGFNSNLPLLGIYSHFFNISFFISTKILYLWRVFIFKDVAKIRNNFQPTKKNGDNFLLMDNILSRIEEISRKEGLTLTAFERSIGASKGVLSRAVKYGTDIQSKWIQTIVENYPQYSPLWLLTGKGDMYFQPTKKIGDIFSSNLQISHEDGIGTPYYNVDFIGGFSEIFNSQATVPTCNIIVPGFEKATVWCNVTGHSMEPKITHGDIIALRQCEVRDIQYGEIYAVVLDTIRTIKILRKGSTKEFLRYVPINIKDFDEQEYEISRIIKIFEVIGSISKFF